MARPLVINEALCFITKKRGRYAVKQLKALLFDFYDEETIAVAKNTLLAAVNELNVDGCSNVIRKRRQSKENVELKIRNDIDDVILLMTFVDEKNVADRLPIYVAADPDLIPSGRLTDGDFQVLISKLDKIDANCTSMRSELNSRSVNHLRFNANTGSKKGVDGISGANIRFQSGRPAFADSEGLSSALDSECDIEGKDAEEFFTPKSRNDLKRANALKKRARDESSVGPSFSDIVAKPPSKLVMLGQAGSSSLKAADKLYVSKSVYRVGNVDSSNTSDDVKQFVQTLGVRVVSCYERTSSKRLLDANKTFRICIFTADRAKFLSPDNWSVGICIEKWMFKPKADDHESEAGRAPKSSRVSDSPLPGPSGSTSTATAASVANTDVVAAGGGLNKGVNN